MFLSRVIRQKAQRDVTLVTDLVLALQLHTKVLTLPKQNSRLGPGMEDSTHGRREGANTASANKEKKGPQQHTGRTGARRARKRKDEERKETGKTARKLDSGEARAAWEEDQ
jgi:hypothetical protein